MLNKPKFMTPSINNDSCVVDVNADKITFSCIVDGDEPIYAWRIKIYKLSDNSLILDTGKKDLTTPFFPIDEKNRNVVFSIDLNSQSLEGVQSLTTEERNALTADNCYTDLIVYDTVEQKWYRCICNNSSSVSWEIAFKNDNSEYYWTIDFWNMIDKDAEGATVSGLATCIYDSSAHDGGNVLRIHITNEYSDVIASSIKVQEKGKSGWIEFQDLSNPKFIGGWLCSSTFNDGKQYDYCYKKSSPYPTSHSCEEVFFANSAPAISGIKYGTDKSSISETLTDGAILPSNQYYFKAEYSQAENVRLKKYGWRLTDTDSGVILFDTISKKQVYGLAENIIFSYDGFLNNGNYAIEVYVETQNGDSLLTPPINFSVSYKTTFLSSDFVVDALDNEPGIMANWSKTNAFKGHSTGEIKYEQDYPIKGNTSVKMENDSAIYFDYNANSDLEIPDDAWVTLSTQLLDSSDRTIFEMEGSTIAGETLLRRLSFKNGKFVYRASITDLNGDIYPIDKEYTPTNTPGRYVWFIFTMSPYLGTDGNETVFRVTERTAKNELAHKPSSNLTPSETLVPSFGGWNTNDSGGGS